MTAMEQGLPPHVYNAEMMQQQSHHHNPYQHMDLREQIARRVEQERLDKIYEESRVMRASLSLVQGRCNICTLKPPCRHTRTSQMSTRSYVETNGRESAKMVEHYSRIVSDNPALPHEASQLLKKSTASAELLQASINKSTEPDLKVTSENLGFSADFHGLITPEMQVYDLN